jgi:glycerol-3-phosphate dehydrogenase
MASFRPDTGEIKLLKQYGIYDHLVDDNTEGLITVLGVKYTTHRDVARKAIDLVFKKLGKKIPKCLTAETPIYGGEIDRFEDYLAEAIRSSILNEELVRHLVHNYGSKYKDILKYADEEPDMLETLGGPHEVLKAEILHAVREQMALKLSDAILRRTDVGSGRDPGEKTFTMAAQIMAKELGWNEARTQNEIEETVAIYAPA